MIPVEMIEDIPAISNQQSQPLASHRGTYQRGVTRRNAITRQIERLERRLIELEDLYRRMSWWRLGAFTFGVLVTYLGVIAGNAWMDSAWIGIACFLLGVAVFALTVWRYQRLGSWIAWLRTWRDMRKGQVARLDLDWDNIPSFSSPDGGDNTPASRNNLALDLDLVGKRSLHALIDRGISYEGSERLAGWLAAGSAQLGELHQRQAAVGELVGMSRFRDRLYANLKRVSDEPLRGAGLLEWLSVEIPAGRLRFLLIFSSLFCVTNLTLFALNIAGVIPPVWPVTFLLYLAFYFTSIGSLRPFLDAVVRMDTELDKFRSLLTFLETFPSERYPQVGALCATFQAQDRLPSRQLRGIRGVTAMAGARMNPIAALVLNQFTPWDFVAAYLASRLRLRASETIPAWFEAWTRLEVLSALADFGYLNPDYTMPEVVDGSGPGKQAPGNQTIVFQAKEMGHPLIPSSEKVCNDVTIRQTGEVILITGSNMAGKSTFIKTVGANLCLAYAGAPVDAASFHSRLFRLHTCIRISDSITDGFSYFYAEVKCLKRLLERLNEPGEPPLLYMIDEIFRGTNNRERYLGSRAYIEALVDTKGVGLIATHDLELANLSSDHPSITNVHFSDTVADGRLYFDYRLRPGPSQTTNALKIMEMEGLPVDRT